ncbi:glycoside hydrolase family 2 protein [candidate division KSB1 bacterium]|nr:glycoside hydrolase family 2 protein [candidate division KSB1 bacterium]
MLTVLQSCGESGRTDLVRINLSGKWQFRQAHEKNWHPATVPGTVHTDLMADGKIKDSFYRMNEREQQWIDKVDWEYQRTFQVDDDILKKDHLELTFEGLDTYADIYLNDVLLLSTDNMFREWTVEAKSHLHPGENILRIYFHSPINTDLPKLAELGYDLPAVNDQSENGGLGNKRVSIFARKAGYHYGWDWGPRLITAGIWRDVELVGWNNTKILSMRIVQNQLDDNLAKLTAEFEINATGTHNAELHVYLGDNDDDIAKQKVKLEHGIHTYNVPFEIKKPKRWWSNGLGEPHLYTVKGVVRIGKTRHDECITRIGLRTLRIVRDPDSDGSGKSFYVELNGVPVFAKGANYIPCDNFVPRVTRERYEQIIMDAVNAHMNMLRVWGGGIYENDIFYDLCDEHGIMVWQDFMFACAMYPGDQEFLENVREEAIQNVKRLRNHPCIALWCGNNENDTAWGYGTDGGWTWKESYDKKIRDQIWNDYEAVFHKMLPEIIDEFDPDRLYWPSSPLADFNKRADIEAKSGDIHYWGVWHGNRLFENFDKNIGRFMSEYGFQSFPEFKSVKQYTLPEDWDIDSPVMMAHQRSGKGNRVIKWYMDHYYKEPKDFESLLYVGQLLQAWGVQRAMETHREHMPFCMGSLYWQLNDCWPVASWSSVDYYGRWKALHYAAKRTYQDILVLPREQDGELHVTIVSDRLQPLNAQLKLTLMDVDGIRSWENTQSVTIAANTSKLYFSQQLSTISAQLDTTRMFVVAQVMNDNKEIARNILYFVTPRNLVLPTPKLDVSYAKLNNGYRITMSTDKLAKNVYFSIDADGFLTDNYFDLLPGERKMLNFECEERPEDFKTKVKIVTLRDSYK